MSCKRVAIFKDVNDAPLFSPTGYHSVNYDKQVQQGAEGTDYRKQKKATKAEPQVMQFMMPAVF